MWCMSGRESALAGLVLRGNACPCVLAGSVVRRFLLLASVWFSISFIHSSLLYMLTSTLPYIHDTAFTYVSRLREIR